MKMNPIQRNLQGCLKSILLLRGFLIFLLPQQPHLDCHVEAIPFVPRTPTRSRTIPVRRPWYLPRGGDASLDNNHNFYTAVGFQVIGASESDTSSSSSWMQGSPMKLFQGDDTTWEISGTTNQNWRVWQGDAGALESLASCCDVMVLVVVIDKDYPAVDPYFVQALAQGFQHRASNGMITSVLLLLVTRHGSNPSDLSEAKQKLLLKDLSRWTPRLITNYSVLSLDDPSESTHGLATAWQEVLKDTQEAPSQTTSHLAEAKAFPRLVHDIYLSTGGTNPDFMQALENGLVAVGNDKTNNDSNKPLDDSTIDDSTISTKVTNNIEDDTTTMEGNDDEEPLRVIVASTQRQIQDLETQLEQQWLAGDEAGTPGVAFGPKADVIIHDYQTATIGELQDPSQTFLWQSVLPSLKQLYDQHLQFLREQCGKQYEEQLQHSTSHEEVDQQQQVWKEAAATCTENFRQAAQAAVPTQCQAGGSLRDANFDYVPALEGLLKDMMQATEDYQELLGVDEVDVAAQDDTSPQRSKPKRPARWYEKVAAKAFVFAVNYFQGWLAYQGIKRAASERDKHLPKFPLF